MKKRKQKIVPYLWTWGENEKNRQNRKSEHNHKLQETEHSNKVNIPSSAINNGSDGAKKKILSRA